MNSGIEERVGLGGWVEIIVKDKEGRVKYRFPDVKEEEEEGEKKEDCAFPPILSSFPAKLQEFHWRKNIITDVGIAAAIRLIFAGLTETKFAYLAIGTGTAPETPADTALGNEIARKAASITQVSTSITGDTARLEAEFSSSDGIIGTHAISESGIFNAATGGIMLARKTFPVITLNFDLGDSITVRYFVQMTRV